MLKPTTKELAADLIRLTENGVSIFGVQVDKLDLIGDMPLAEIRAAVRAWLDEMEAKR